MLKLAVIGLCLAFCQGALLGGWNTVDTSDDGVQDAASFAESTINARSNSMFSSRVTQVIRAERQVVNGYNYEVTFEFSQTTCRKQMSTDLQSCQLGGRVEVCEAQIYVPIEGQKQLSSFSCQPATKKREIGKLVGGVSKPKTNPQEYADIAWRAVTMSNSALTEVSVLSVKTQVVAGTKYIMKIQAREGQKIRTCDVEVWSRPWMGEDNFIVQKFDCNKDE